MATPLGQRAVSKASFHRNDPIATTSRNSSIVASACVLLTSLSFAACSSWFDASPATVEGTRLAPMTYSSKVSGVLVARPFVFEGRTVLEFNAEPGLVLVRAPSGVSIPFERSGRFIKLTQWVDQFTVLVDGREMVVAMEQSRKATSLVPPKVEATTSPSVETTAPSSLQDAIGALQREVAQLKQQLAAKPDFLPQAPSSESRPPTSMGAPAHAYTITVSGMPTGAHAFRPDHPTRQRLLDAASNAPFVRVIAFTSSGSDSAAMQWLARARAKEATRFLVANGVDAAKIESKAWSHRNFVVSNKTAEGRALNRRIEFTFSSTKLADHDGPSIVDDRANQSTVSMSQGGEALLGLSRTLTQ